jgi:uncharacterized damage-inducible protein DinB
MITRIWHGRTSTENAPRYLDFLLNEGTDEYRQTEGNISTKVWKQGNAKECDFWTVTEWDNLDSIRQFAGTDYQKAKYYPFDDNMLLEFEEQVSHYESYNVSNTKIRIYIEQIERLYWGGNWVGESFNGKLKELKSEHVFSAPVPGVHSVAEIVWHCIYWRTVTLRRLHGDQNKYRNATMEIQNFLPVRDLQAKGWKQILDELEETQISLLDFLKDKTDSFLQNEYQPGYNYDFLLEGTIQHDFYHLGQVGLVLKILSMTENNK